MNKIKDVIKLKKGYKYLSDKGIFETTAWEWYLSKKDDLWITNCGLHKFSETTIRENPELFEDVYDEPERKKICVEIEYDYLETRFGDLDLFQVRNCLENTNCYINDRNIKVTEIKPPEISKEDVKWLYDKFACSFRTLDTVWAEFQAKKEAENG